jgi:hypothetical protein
VTEHDDLTARLRKPRQVWVNGNAMTIMDPDDVYRDMHEAADLIDSLTRERDELAATVERLAEAIERAHPWVEYLLAHVAVDWSPPEEEVLRRDVEFVRQVAADTEEVGDRG